MNDDTPYTTNGLQMSKDCYAHFVKKYPKEPDRSIALTLFFPCLFVELMVHCPKNMRKELSEKLLENLKSIASKMQVGHFEAHEWEEAKKSRYPENS
jgi:hypothetical protein